VLCDEVICFRPAKKRILFLVECNQSENPVPRKRQTLCMFFRGFQRFETVENHERTYIASRADLLRASCHAFIPTWGGTRKPGNQRLWKNQEGGTICSLHKKIQISRACETK